jgi:hypothetical protein
VRFGNNKGVSERDTFRVCVCEESVYIQYMTAICQRVHLCFALSTALHL